MLLIVAALGLAAWGLWRVTGTGPTVTPSPTDIVLIAESDRAALPDFAFRDDRGTLRHMRDEIGPRPLLIHFWATWCRPCLPEVPSLDALAKTQAGKVRVLPLALDRDAVPKVQKFFAERQIQFLPILAPEPGAPTPAALPASILVDRMGRIAWSAVGAHSWDGTDVMQALDRLK